MRSRVRRLAAKAIRECIHAVLNGDDASEQMPLRVGQAVGRRLV